MARVNTGGNTMKNPVAAFILGFAVASAVSLAARLFFDLVIFGDEFNDLNWLSIILTMAIPAIAVGVVSAVITNNRNKKDS